VRYFPNPAHKKETTQAGPPAWRPNKELCPEDLTVAERQRLFEASISRDPSVPGDRRWTLRRTESGIEFFDINLTGHLEGDYEFHGHPASYVPAVILRQFRDDGAITPSEYKRLVRSFAVPDRP